MPRRLQITLRDVAILTVCLVFCMFLAWFDFVTGEDLDFFALYYVPIAGAVWLVGWPAGLAVAFAAAGAWLGVDYATHTPYVWSIGACDTGVRLFSFAVLALALARIRDDLARQRRLNDDLRDAMAQIKQLSGILPICSICKKIRDTGSEWVPLERYICKHSEAQLSHGLCPACFRKFYGESNGT